MAERVADAERFLHFLFDMETSNLRTLLANNGASMIALSTLYGYASDGNNEESTVNRFVRGEMQARNLDMGQHLTILLWKENLVAGGLYEDAIRRRS
jgi:hypothetical protein